MKTILCLTTLFLLFISLSACAADTPGVSGRISIQPINVEEEPKSFVKADRAQAMEAKRVTWFENQLRILSLSEKKNVFQQKSIANVYKRIKDQTEWNKNYTIKKFIEISTKRREIAATVSSYGEYLMLQTNGSYIRYFGGKPTDIFNLSEKDDYGNTHKVNIMNIKFAPDDQFVSNNDTTDTHYMEYIKLDYDPTGAIDYTKFFDAVYASNIGDRPSVYTTVEGTALKTPQRELTNPTDEASARALYRKIVDEIIPNIQSALTYTVTTAFSKIVYYSLQEDNATLTTAGGVYGEKKNYDYNLSTTSAPDAPETGSVSNVKYYLLDKKYAVDPLPEYWWHAQNATLANLHRTQEAKEASSNTVYTTLGITREIDFANASYDAYNSLSRYQTTEKINGTTVETSSYHDISYDSYGRQTSYVIDGNTYGLSYSRTYSNITYDSLSRISAYNMNETIDGTTTLYRYWNMQYNTLWQVNDYYYSVDGVEHHLTSITYNSYGLIASYDDEYMEDGVNVTLHRENFYDEHGLLKEYTEQKLRQSDTVHEFYYTWVGNITYNSIYAIIAFDTVNIRDTDAVTFSNYYDKIPTIVNALIFDGVSYTLNAIDMIALGFDTYTTIYTEKWRNAGYYSVGESIGSNYYNFTLDSFRGRMKTYVRVVRTTTTTTDTAEIIIL